MSDHDLHLDRLTAALAKLHPEMPAPIRRSSANYGSSALTAVIGNLPPHLIVFTSVLLLLVYGYEIFNFSLSIDEELSGSGYGAGPWRGSIAQGRWAMGVLAAVFPPLGHIPMLSTILFCVGLGLSGCVLARVLFRDRAAQWTFAGMFVASPLWPHIGEFNTISWIMGVGWILIVLSFVFIIAEDRLSAVWATVLLAIATGIYQTFFTLFLVLLCLRLLSLLLGSTPEKTELRQGFRWLRSGLVVAGGLLLYVVVEMLLLQVLSLSVTYLDHYMRLEDFTTVPEYAIKRTLQRCWNLLSGADPIFLGYGYIVTLLPLLGLLLVLVYLFRRAPLTGWQRLLGIGVLAVALVLGISPILVSAGIVPARSLIAWVPLSAFLAAFVLAHKGRFEKPLYVALGAALLISIWISVSLFYTDHIARQRDQLLATRIMVRVDQLLPNPPPGRIPFVVVGSLSANDSGPFRKLEVFGDSFFDASHEGGNPYRVAAYFRLLGIDTLEPRPLSEAAQYRDVIEAMPMWPVAGSVAIVNGMLVIKLGPMPRR